MVLPPLSESLIKVLNLKYSASEEPVSVFSESQKKKSNNQDDSDEDDDDDDEAGPSTQHAAAAAAAVPPQAGYGAPMAQLGMPPVAGAPGMHPGGYQGENRPANPHWVGCMSSCPMCC